MISLQVVYPMQQPYSRIYRAEFETAIHIREKELASEAGITAHAQYLDVGETLTAFS